MNKILSACLILVFISCKNENKPVIEIYPEVKSFGILKKDSTYQFPIRIKNNSNKKYQIEDYTTFCDCTNLSISKTYVIRENLDSIFHLTITPNEVSEKEFIYQSHFRIKDLNDFVKLEVGYKCVK